MTFYRPTDIERAHARAEIEKANLLIGQFVTAWSRLEMRLRTLEIMHIEGHKFRPIDDLDSVDLRKNRRFKQRIDVIIPKDVEVSRGTTLHDWLLDTHKIRNLLLHGIMIGYSPPGEKSEGEPAIVHSDVQATLSATRGFPNVTRAQVPEHKGSLKPDTVLVVAQLTGLIGEVRRVEESLSKRIDAIHASTEPE